MYVCINGAPLPPPQCLENILFYATYNYLILSNLLFFLNIIINYNNKERYVKQMYSGCHVWIPLYLEPIGRIHEVVTNKGLD